MVRVTGEGGGGEARVVRASERECERLAPNFPDLDTCADVPVIVFRFVVCFNDFHPVGD